eukprot:jgi/Mesen1/9648/ME000671S09027
MLSCRAEPSWYELPTWANFELGRAPVFWETANGRGFNSPIMCGGEPRQMTRKDRGPTCAPFYTIKINVPTHAMNIQFSFTDGSQWDGPFVLDLEVPAKWRNMPVSFFNEGASCELDLVSGCTDPESPQYNPFANIDDGSCPLDF